MALCLVCRRCRDHCKCWSSDSPGGELGPSDRPKDNGTSLPQPSAEEVPSASTPRKSDDIRGDAE